MNDDIAQGVVGCRRKVEVLKRVVFSYYVTVLLVAIERDVP